MLDFIKWCIRHFKTLSFFGGFALDLIFLPKTTSPYYIWIGPLDIGIVFGLIVLRQTIKRALKNKDKRLRKEKKENKGSQETEGKTIEELKTKGHRFLERLNLWLTWGVSFFLGTLLSHVLVYYFRSSDVLQMWPIFLIVLLAIIANEFMYGTIPDILLFFIGVTFFFIFNVPFALNKVNSYTFFIAILISVITTSIAAVALQRIYLSTKEFVLLILFSIFFPFLLLRLYYINYIPAVPLALGDSGFYSYVYKINNDQGYYYKKETLCITEKKILYIFKKVSCEVSSLNTGDFYFFSSIISPADVSADITHVWEKYDPANKKWIKQSEINYPISGGREDGYRGYSKISNISKGEWRVKVMADGRLVGLRKILIW